ncbi:hypothetical protein L1049_015718 [Liquidambar formosana]|uniref:Uncharacterized protein n=1 Tax=Liquidambar formosana TaxID=63359 RepID=A0AAP0X6R4_LIQFO
MASSPLNPKTHYHARSISLPSRRHPLINQLDEHLCRLRSSEATSSLSSIGEKLSGLRDLYDCVDELLLLPLPQLVLAQERHEKWVDEVFDGSLRLLDVCGTTKDVLLQTKENAQELQSILRRRRGDDSGLANGVGEYLTSRKKAKKVIRKSLRDLKSKCIFSPLDKDHDTLAVVGMLREVEEATLTVLESFLSFIYGLKAQSKPSSWSLISKLLHSKRVVCEEYATEINEFEVVDAALHTLVSDKTKSSNVHAEKVQKELEKLESSIQDLEEGLEPLLRRLIKTRVSLLNILNH